MEFLDEDARPRFVLQSKPIPQTQPESDPDRKSGSKIRPGTFISISISIPLLLLSLLYSTSEPLKSLLLWLSVSLLIGPFAPPSSTAGDIRVGLGPPIQPNDPIDTDPVKPSKKSAKQVRKPVEFGSGSGSGPIGSGYAQDPVRNNGSSLKSEKIEVEVMDWSDGDLDLLRKLLGKNPVGKPGRWEAIAEGFKGRHRVESVIKKAKELGEKKTSDEDSYQKFLKDRKQVDKRVESEIESSVDLDSKAEGKNVWSSSEDLALLNALKAFPKEVAMRWEKIAAAVPGKTKTACMKRVTELKRDFRSSKASS